MESEQKRNWWKTAIATIVTLLAIYGGGYIVICEERSDPHFTIPDESNPPRGSNFRARHYRTKAVAAAFIPAAWVESQLIGKPVSVWYPIGTERWQAERYLRPLVRR